MISYSRVLSFKILINNPQEIWFYTDLAWFFVKVNIMDKFKESSFEFIIDMFIFDMTDKCFEWEYFLEVTATVEITI